MATVAETHGRVIPHLCFMAHGGLSEACFWRCPWKCWSIPEWSRPTCCRHILYGPLKRQETQYHRGNDYIWELHFYWPFPFFYNFTGKYLLKLSEWNCSSCYTKFWRLSVQSPLSCEAAIVLISVIVGTIYQWRWQRQRVCSYRRLVQLSIYIHACF